VAASARHKLPWVLDPVFVDRTPLRAAFARELIARRPNMIRLNHPEFSALSGKAPSREAAGEYAHANRIVVAISGKTDLVTDGGRVMTVSNGHPLMAKVTAIGCAGSALVAACLAVETDVFRASAAALIVFGVAGELAAEKSPGPGSFAVAIIDALYNLDGPTLIARAKVS